MKIFKIEEYVRFENPTPGKLYRPEILTKEHKAQDLGGLFAILVPGAQVPYHYHNNRESLFIGISGEGTETIEGREYTIKAGDVLYIPAGEKHGLANRSAKDFRYLEFYTYPPIEADFVEVE